MASLSGPPMNAWLPSRQRSATICEKAAERVEVPQVELLDSAVRADGGQAPVTIWNPCSPARRAASAARKVLPMPLSPSKNTARPCPRLAASRCPPISSSTRSRPAMVGRYK